MAKAPEPAENGNPKAASEQHRIIGQKLRAARLRAGLTQQKLGEAVGVTFQQIQKYEHGTNRIDISRMHHFAKLLNVDLDYFTGSVNVKRNATTASFDALLASRHGVQMMEAMVKLTEAQRQFLIDIARRIPQLAEADA